MADPHAQTGESPKPSLYRRRRRLLAAGVAAPVVALFALGLALLAYPGFDQARQYMSELGGPASHAPMIFNLGVLAAGLMAALAGLGFGLALRALGAGRVPSGMMVAAFMVGGGGLMASAVIPWPDHRHYLLVNLGLGIEIAPLLLLWGLRRAPGFKALKTYLAAMFAIMAGLTWITWPGLCPWAVTPANVGWWERAFAFSLVSWVAVAAFALDRRLLAEAAQSQVLKGAANSR